MSCKNCGTPIDHAEKFCPNCGHEITDFEKQKKKKSSSWFAVFIALLLLVISYLALSGNEVTETVNHQLEAIRENQLTEAYYSFTSKIFQKITPLDVFHENVKALPLFLKDKTIEVKEKEFDNEVANVEAIVKDPQGIETLLHYQLIKEEGNWKILNMELSHPNLNKNIKAGDNSVSENVVVPTSKEPSLTPDVQLLPGLPKTEDNFDATPLYKLVEAQLQKIKDKDFVEAYYRFASHDFQETTALKEFTDFLNTHEAFVNYKSIEFNNLSVENNVAIVSANLFSTKNEIFPVDYQFVFEEGGWKIFNVQTYAPISAEALSEEKAPLTFEKFILGTTIDNKGIITDPKTSFPRGAEDIHLNLYLKHAKAGTKIIITVEYRKYKAPSMTAIVPDDGDNMLSFSFPGPEKGWPKGEYTIYAESSTKIEKTTIFIIE